MFLFCSVPACNQRGQCPLAVFARSFSNPHEGFLELLGFFCRASDRHTATAFRTCFISYFQNSPGRSLLVRSTVIDGIVGVLKFWGSLITLSWYVMIARPCVGFSGLLRLSACGSRRQGGKGGRGDQPGGHSCGDIGATDT